MKFKKTFKKFAFAYELGSLQFDCAISGGADVHSVQGEMNGIITLWQVFLGSIKRGIQFRLDSELQLIEV